MSGEAARIQLLIARDGQKAAEAWVERTLKAYREAVQNPSCHASRPTYRPLFEQSIREFEAWLVETQHVGNRRVSDGPMRSLW